MNVRETMRQDSPVDRTVFYKWSQIVGYLEERFGKASVAAWAEDAMVTEFTEDILRIEAGNGFKCEVMKRRCRNHLQTALKELFESDARVEIYALGDKFCDSVFVGTCDF